MTSVLFIAGLGRSGSTLLERTCARLDDTVAVGELVHLWERGVLRNERCGCGAQFADCPFWREVGDVAYGGWVNLDPEQVRDDLAAVARTRRVPQLVSGAGRSFRARADQLRSVLDRLYGAIASVSGCAVVLDSSKHPSYAYLLAGSSDLRLKVIHAVRDPRAVAYSWGRVVERPDAQDTTMTRWTARETSTQWTVQNGLAAGLRRVGAPTTVVQYEDFVADPAGVIRRIAAFADMVPPAELVAELEQRCVSLEVAHTVSGNPVRFTTGRVDIRLDDAWTRELPRRDARTATVLTAPVRPFFGYRRSSV